jgi:ABC-2 type transport system ATP-binding protein
MFAPAKTSAGGCAFPTEKHDYAVTEPLTIVHPAFACTRSISTVVVGATPYGVRMAGAIVVEGLVKSFGSVEALRGINLDVAPGTVFGLLGPNGAGKTTAIRILTTLLLPDGGRAEVVGLDVVRDAEVLRSRFGLAGQSAAVDENLTGLENIEMVGRLYHLPSGEARRRAVEILERFGLADAADRQAKTYSGGMRRRLDVAASLVARPDVLFLDEPTTGLDPRSRMDLWAMIRELVNEGKTILLTTQYLEEADNLADRIAVIDLGTVIAEGTSDELKDQIGGEVLEIHVQDRTDLAKIVQILAGIGTGEPMLDHEAGRIRIPVGSAGPSALLDSVRRVDDGSIAIADIALHRPTLDDVFLSLTGHAAEQEEDQDAAATKRRGRARGEDRR